MNREQAREYQRDRRARGIPIPPSRKAEYIARNTKYMLDYLEAHPCVDCGEDDLLVLEFDHVRGDKTADVSRLVGRGAKLSRVVEEIKKCDVVCANDHKRRTNKRAGSSRLERWLATKSSCKTR